MIQLFEITLLQQIQSYWNNMIANIGQSGDIVPLIFAQLPSTGSGGSNQAAIAAMFTEMAVQGTTNSLNFLLQFPQNKAHIPSIVIESGPEQELECIGSEVAYINPSNGVWDHCVGSVYTKQFAVGTFSYNADSTLYLFAFLKYCLMDIRPTLTFVSNIHISSRQLMVDPETFGSPVYYRYIDLNVEGLIDYVVNTYGQVESVTVTVNEETAPE